MAKLRTAILISGRGSNMRALIDAARASDFPAQISVVISNRPEAEGLLFARAAGIATVALDHKAYDSKAAFEAAVEQALAAHGVELVCLAGFMRLLSADFVARWDGRMINIHPSLLPAYKGLHTHERALADGVRKHGCTVHFVSAGMDEGAILLQREVAVFEGDTPDSLAARVLEQEHIAYPQALRELAMARLSHP